MPPLIKNLDEFKMRFGIPNVATLFNMTEVSTPLCTDFDLSDYASCGRPRPGVTARIVDEFDEPVPVGATGELILRSDNAWEFNLGYWRQPEKTAEAWRNQWLHTGDLFSQDQDGNFYFRDRLKDAIRRRGENISSYEIEREIDAHPSVLESAAVAVPSPFGEEEVKVVVAIRPGAALTPEDLITHLMLRLPSYMLPRFVEVCSTELPKTPTGKIRKDSLREAGSASAWDRDALRS
jgi:crotonobetaine/carnitine-CoA ligase